MHGNPSKWESERANQQSDHMFGIGESKQRFHAQADAVVERLLA
jgi:hypothetical protein